MEDEEPKNDLSSLRIDREKRYSDRPRSRKWLWVLWIAILAAIAVGYILLRHSITPAMRVKTAQVRLVTGSEAAAELVATGYVVAQRKAEVASKGTGRLEYLGFEEGDRVRAGEIIARLDNEDIKANLELARANLKQAQVDSLDAGRNYRRQLTLFESGAITDVALEAAEARYQNALAGVAGRAAAVRVAEVNLENTYIKAPFDGTILTKNADVGEMVTPFASSISSKGSVVTLADMNSLEVEADVSEANIYKVRFEQPCQIILDAYPGTRYAGYVKKIVPTADRARATVLTKVAFNEIDDRVLPEMSARVHFLINSGQPESSPETTALAIPKEAVTSRNGQKIVFRIDGQYVTAIPVETGRELGKTVEILSGLSAKEQVVLSPPGKMASGQKVEITF